MIRLVKGFQSSTSSSVKAAAVARPLKLFKTNYATEKTIKTPSMGESITEGTLTQWLKSR
jgi:hypothetical protein